MADADWKMAVIDAPFLYSEAPLLRYYILNKNVSYVLLLSPTSYVVAIVELAMSRVCLKSKPVVTWLSLTEMKVSLMNGGNSAST